MIKNPQKENKNRKKIMKLIKTTNNKGRINYYSIKQFICKLNKGEINVESNVIEVVKVIDELRLRK